MSKGKRVSKGDDRSRPESMSKPKYIGKRYNRRESTCMGRPNRRPSQDGFTLIEVVAAAALLAVVCTGFLMMTAANAGRSAKEYRLDRSIYDLSVQAEEGQGEATGETLEVEFTLKGREDEGYMENWATDDRATEDKDTEDRATEDKDTENWGTEDRATEVFEQYDIRETGEDQGSHMTYYRYR